MGRRSDKGRAIARYLTGRTGVPFIRWENNGIAAPYPYVIHAITDMKIERFREALNKPTQGLNIVVRYDGLINDLNDAWVGMRLDDFVVLMQAHYESIQDRIKERGSDASGH